MAKTTHDTTKASGKASPGAAEGKHTEEGLEVMDPMPKQPPLGYKKTPSLAEQILQQVRLQRLEDAKLHETEEEADDFEVGEDFEPLSPYENDHMPTFANLKKQAKEINERLEKAKREKAIADYKAKHGKEPPTDRSPEPAPTEPPGGAGEDLIDPR